MPRVNDYLVLMRPKQWLKSIFVFVGWFYSGLWLNAQYLNAVMLAAISFSLMSSAVYIFNDLCDKKADIFHPIKRFRPIASGRIESSHAVLFMFFLIVSAILLAARLNGLAIAIVLLYLSINIGYSLSWKHIPILDVIIIAFGFALRVLMGTLGIDITPSHWLISCVIFLALFLALSKRYAELCLVGNRQFDTRPSLNGYDVKILHTALYFFGGCVWLLYGIYRFNQALTHGEPSFILLMSWILSGLGLLRYLNLIPTSNQDEPMMIICQDKSSRWLLVLWLMVSIISVNYVN